MIRLNNIFRLCGVSSGASEASRNIVLLMYECMQGLSALYSRVAANVLTVDAVRLSSVRCKAASALRQTQEEKEMGSSCVVKQNKHALPHVS